MRRAVWIAGGMLIAIGARALGQTPAPSPAPVQASAPAAVSAGEALFKKRCATCHQGGNGEGVPTMDELARFKPDDVYDILTNGVMVSYADGLTEDELGAIIDYVTRKPSAAAQPAVSH